MNEIFHPVAVVVVRYLLAGSVVALPLAPLVLIILRVARIQAPVYRHMIWFYCLVAIAVLPLLWLYGPKVSLAVLPDGGVSRGTVSDGPISSVGTPVALYDPEFEPPITGVTRNPVAGSSTPAAQGSLSWQIVVAGLWGAGVLIMAARLVVGCVGLRRIYRASIPLSPEQTAAHLQRCTIRVRLSSQLHGPVCFGLLRPAILLPRQMYHASSPQTLRMVLTHELAHIQRRDGWASLFQRLLEAVFFFHPLVWFASRQLTQEREHICDNYVLAEGAAPDEYSILLSQIGEQTLGMGRSLQAVALFEGQLLARIRRLLDPGGNRQTRLSRQAALLCSLTAVCGLFLIGSVRLAAEPVAAHTEVDMQSPADSDASADTPKRNPLSFSARTFNSDLPFRVRVTLEVDGGSEVVGHTPAEQPLAIPECAYWSVEPVQGVDLKTVRQEIQAQHIPGLTLSGAVSDADLAALAGLEALQVLILRATQVTDTGLAYLETLTKLQSVNLRGTRITDAGLAYLKDMRELRHLDLSDTPITDAGLVHLKELPRLTFLVMANTQISDAGLSLLGDLGELEALVVRGTSVTDDGLMHLKGVGSLQRLNLEGTQITDSGLAHLADFKRLTLLVLANTRITDAGLVHLTGLDRLKTLGLWGTQITDGGLRHLTPLSQLEQLYLFSTQLTDDGMMHLSDLKGLKRLGLVGTDVGDYGLSYLRKLTGLEEIFLDYCSQISDTGLRHLEDLNELRALGLSGTPIGDAGVIHLKGLQKLRHLVLGGTRITDVGLAHLADLNELRLLLLSGTQITDDGLVYLQSLGKVRSLLLQETQITDAGLMHLRGLESLAELNVWGTPVTNAGVDELKQWLPHTDIIY